VAQVVKPELPQVSRVQQTVLGQLAELVSLIASPELTRVMAAAAVVVVGVQLVELVERVAVALVEPPRVLALMELQIQAAAVAVVPQDVCSAAKVEVDVSSYVLRTRLPLLLNPQRPARLAANHTPSV
jgi:hypothetical protein